MHWLSCKRKPLETLNLCIPREGPDVPAHTCMALSSCFLSNMRPLDTGKNLVLPHLMLQCAKKKKCPPYHLQEPPPAAATAQSNCAPGYFHFWTVWCPTAHKGLFLRCAHTKKALWKNDFLSLWGNSSHPMPSICVAKMFPNSSTLRGKGGESPVTSSVMVKTQQGKEVSQDVTFWR